MSKTLTYALGAVFFWSTIASAFAIGLREMGGLQLMLGASLVSMVVLLGISTLRGGLGRFRKITAADMRFSAMLGLLNPFAYYAVLLKAYSILPAQEAMMLNYLWPVMLVVLAIPLRGQRVSKGEWFALATGFVGILVVATQGNLASLRFAHPLGDALALGSTVIWALYWNLNARREGDAVVRLVLNLAFGSIYLLIGALCFTGFEPPTWRGLGAIVYVGLFETGITFYLWLTAMRLSVSTARISQLIFISPFLSLCWIRLFLGEKIHPATLAGLLFVVGGALLQNRIATKRWLSAG